MAKKQTAKTVEVAPQEAVIETPVVKAPKTEAKPEPKKPKWEIKDRVYFLKGKKKPLSKAIKAAGIYYFDEEKGYEREIKYCENQQTPFVDEMKGDQRLSHIIFRNGALHIPKNKTVLQKLLSLYHPQRDKVFFEHKPQVVAENELDWLEFEVEALTICLLYTSPSPRDS